MILMVALGWLVGTLGGCIVGLIQWQLWTWLNLTEKVEAEYRWRRRIVSQLLGVIERTAYMVAFLSGFPGWVAVYFAIKGALNWRKKRRSDYAYNVVLIGNLLSLGFAVLGTWIALGLKFPP